MPKLFRKTLKVPAVVLARLGIVWPFVFLYARVIKPARPESSRGDGRPALLALTAEHFLGDLEVLADSGEFRVLRLPFSWQARLILLFYPPDLPRRQYLQADTNARVARARKGYRAFLKAFLPRLYRRLGITGVPLCGQNDEVLRAHGLDSVSLAKAIAASLHEAA